jgi:hypothetical protein
MPTFMQSLAANPSGSSGIYGQPAPQNQDVLGIVNNIKDREMRDFKNKASFMSDLSLKQDRMKRIYDNMDVVGNKLQSDVAPRGQQPQTDQSGTINTVQKSMDDFLNPGQAGMTGAQKGELSIKQSQMGLERDKLKQQGQMGEEALGIKQQAADLKQQQNDEINQRKIKEGNDRLTIAQQKLDQQGQTIENLTEYRAAMENRHGLEKAQQQKQFDDKMANTQSNFDTTHTQMQQKIDNLTQANKDKPNKKVTSTMSPDGQSKTTTTQTGSAAQTVQVQGKDGKTYTIPADMQDEWNQNHAPDGSGDSSGGDASSNGQ